MSVARHIASENGSGFEEGGREYFLYLKSFYPCKSFACHRDSFLVPSYYSFLSPYNYLASTELFTVFSDCLLRFKERPSVYDYLWTKGLVCLLCTSVEEDFVQLLYTHGNNYLSQLQRRNICMFMFQYFSQSSG